MASHRKQQMGSIRKNCIRWGMRAFLFANALMARRPFVGRLIPLFMTGLAARTVRRKDSATCADPQTLGLAWQGAFVSRKHVPIVAVDSLSAYGQILTPCPLRGTGDLQACWRMMAFDREVARRAGGHFFVLASQTESGRTFCEVAISTRSDSHVDVTVMSALRRI